MIYEYRNKNNGNGEMNIGNMTVGFVLGVIACLLMTMCSSCTTTQYVTVPEYHTDTVLVNKTTHDSIFVHDSVSVFQKGDTVQIEKWHTKYVLKEVHDTTYIAKRDSIPYPVEIKTTELVERQLTWWEKTRMYIGTVVLIGLFIIITIYILRYYLQKH